MINVHGGFTTYAGEDKICLDDLRPHSLNFRSLLRYLDSYPVSLNVKHGSVPLRATLIVVTSPLSPEAFAKKACKNEYDGDTDRLMRRITTTLHFPKRDLRLCDEGGVL